MKGRLPIVGIAIAAALALAVMLVRQRTQLQTLRAEQQRLAAEIDSTSNAPVVASAPAKPQTSPPAETPLELLELRSEATRLQRQQRELASVTNENEQLHARLAARRTNDISSTFPPDYMLRSKAQWMGFSTPEDTVQSFLWAMGHADFTNLLRTLTPTAADKLRQQAARSDQFLKDFQNSAYKFPGLRILDRKTLPDGTVELKVEILPGQPVQDPMRLQLINGEWKLAMPF